LGTIGGKGETVYLSSGDTVTLGGWTANSMTVSAWGDIHGWGAITASLFSGLVKWSVGDGAGGYVTHTGNIFLTNPNNRIGVFHLPDAGTIGIVNSAAVTLSAMNVANLSVRSQRSILQVGALTVRNLAVFEAYSVDHAGASDETFHYDISLGELANRFGSLSLIGRSVNIRDVLDGVVLQDVRAGVVSLTVEDNGYVRGAGAVTASTLWVGGWSGANGTVLLTHQANRIGTVSLGAAGQTAALHNAQDLSLAEASLGTLSVSVSGTFSPASSDNTITHLWATAAALTLSNAADLTLHDIRISGALTLRVAADILQLVGAGVSVVGGGVDISAGGSVSLSNLSASDGLGTVRAAGSIYLSRLGVARLSIRSGEGATIDRVGPAAQALGDLTLLGVSVAGDLSVRVDGSLLMPGAVTVGGLVSAALTVAGRRGDLTMSHAANRINTVAVRGDHAVIHDADGDLTLGDALLSGGLTVSASGVITGAVGTISVGSSALIS
nr:hypothetical protein [Gammaproteobacteria bacterium AqS3]